MSIAGPPFMLHLFLLWLLKTSAAAAAAQKRLTVSTNTPGMLA